MKDRAVSHIHVSERVIRNTVATLFVLIYLVSPLVSKWLLK